VGGLQRTEANAFNGKVKKGRVFWRSKATGSRLARGSSVAIKVNRVRGPDSQKSDSPRIEFRLASAYGRKSTRATAVKAVARKGQKMQRGVQLRSWHSRKAATALWVS
jgi:hypothetical protein